MTKRAKIALALLALASIAGLIISGILFAESVALGAGQGAQLCGEGERFGCSEALMSEYSKFPGDNGIALPVWSGAFYFCVLALVMGLARSPRPEGSPSARFLAILFCLDVLLSIFLGYVAFVLLDRACPYCLGLYIVSGVGLAGAFMLRPQLSKLPGELGALFKDGNVWTGVAVFVVGVTIFHIAYLDRVDSATTAETLAATQKIEDATGEHHDRLTHEALAGLPRKGAADAPIIVVEFSDFECPHCERFRLTIDELVEETNPEDVAVYFVHYPIDHACNPSINRPFHQSACQAAKAAMCAHDQGRFWRMHDALFDHISNNRQQPLDEAALRELAAEADVRADDMLTCMQSDATAAALAAQLDLARALDIRGTPSWYINGYFRPVLPEVDKLLIFINRLLELREEEAASGAAPPQPAAPQPVAP